MANLTDILREGKEHATSREILSSMTGMSDRDVRREIESLKRAGHIIINSGQGYYYPTDDDLAEVQKYIKEQEKKAKTMLKELRRYRAWAVDVEKGRF